MALLSKELLKELGIEMRDQDYQLLEEHFETTLRTRVIEEIVEELSIDQARQLATMQQSSDEQLLNWLRANVLNFSEIVSDEVDILLGELAENSDAFNRAADNQSD